MDAPMSKHSIALFNAWQTVGSCMPMRDAQCRGREPAMNRPGLPGSMEEGRERDALEEEQG
jgi:hypothetical protein